MKRKLFRKLMAASLVTAMVVGMTACGPTGDTSTAGSGEGTGATSGTQGSQETPGSQSGDGEEVSQYPIFTDPATGKPYDLGGREFEYYTWFPINDEESAYGDALKEYRAWAEETYNFKMTVNSEGDWAGNFQNLGDLAVGGLASVDNAYRAYLVPGGQGAVMAAMKQNLLWDITSLGVIDFTEHRYAVNGVSDMYQMGGHVYGFSTDIPEPRSGIWFNKQLLEQTTGMTADDLYDLQKNNQWTWEKFEEICQKIYEGGDLDNDGVQDIYALAGNTGSFQTYACTSNNCEMFPVVDGSFTYNAEDPAVIEATDWFLKIMRSDYWYPQPEGTEWDYFYPAFDDEGKIVFLPEDVYHIAGRLSAQTGTEANASNAGEYGLLMFPIGPKAGGKFINGYTDNVVVIPKCYNEEEARSIAIAYNIWSATIPGFEDHNTRLGGYEAHVFDDRMLNETLVRMMSEGAFVKSPGCPGINVGEDTGWWPADQTATQMIEACATKWKSAVEDANK